LLHTIQGKDTRTGRLRKLAEMECAKATERQSSDERGGSETTTKGKEPKATKRQEARRAPLGSCKLRPVKRRKVVFQDDSDEEDWDHPQRADPLWKETAVHSPVREEATPEELLGEPILHSPRTSLQSSPTSQTPVIQSSPSPPSRCTTSPTLPPRDAAVAGAATQTPPPLGRSAPSPVKTAADAESAGSGAGSRKRRAPLGALFRQSIKIRVSTQ
jgi:hypothetical protein